MQLRFIEEYLLDLNATQAAIRAGYSINGARQTAHKLLTKTDISDEIARRAAKLTQRAEIDAVTVLRELARLALSDPRELFDDQGRLRPVTELSDDMAAAVSSVEVVKRPLPGGDELEYIHKVRLWDKNAALTNLAKHFRLLKEILTIEYGDERKIDQDIEQLLEEATARVQDRLER